MSELVISDLRAGVEGKEILRGVDLTVRSGEVHAVMGPNGSGKSTLAHVVMGGPGYEVLGGRVTLDGLDLLGLPSFRRAQAGLFLAMQYPTEVPGVPLEGFLAEALAARGGDRRRPAGGVCVRQRRWVIGTAGLAVLLSACGTRLPDKAFQKSQQVKLKASTGALSGGTGSEQAATGTTGATQATTTGATQAVTGGTGGGGATGGTTGGTGGPKSPSGQGNFASDVGVTADSIKIGNVTAIGGALGPNAFGVTLNGLKTFVSAINDQGGVNGRKLVLDPCDDGADGTRNLSCTQKLVEQDKVFSLLGNNTDASASSANYEFKKGIPDVGFPLNNGYYKYPNMYSIYGVGYARDGKTVGNNGKLENTSGIYRYFKQQAHATKAAVFYYIIPVSAQAGCFEEQGALKEGIPTVYEGGGGKGHCLGAGENPAAPAFDQDVLNMRQAGVDVMFDAMDVSANERLCQAMDRQKFSVKAKVSTIEVWGDIVGNEFSAPCRNSVFVAGLSASYSELSNPMVAR